MLQTECRFAGRQRECSSRSIAPLDEQQESVVLSGVVDFAAKYRTSAEVHAPGGQTSDSWRHVLNFHGRGCNDLRAVVVGYAQSDGNG